MQKQNMFLIYCDLLFNYCYFVSVCSLRSFGLPSCRNCELVNTSSPSHQQHVGAGGRTATSNVTTSSLGLLQLLQERGISSSPHPHHCLHYSHSAEPSPFTERDNSGGLQSDKEGRRNAFSLNLVEKLQGLGLHRVAALGMTGHSGREKQSNLLWRV